MPVAAVARPAELLGRREPCHCAAFPSYRRPPTSLPRNSRRPADHQPTPTRGAVIDLIDAGLKGQQLVPAAQAVTITGSLPHGHVAAAHAMARKLGLPALLGPAGRQRDLALALVISRVVKPGSKLSTRTWCADVTLGATWAWLMPAPMTSTRRWTGWPASRTTSRRNWPAATSARRPTRRGWRCSTCPPRGWKAPGARWPPAATPGTAGKAACRSSTACSPTRTAAGRGPVFPPPPPGSQLAGPSGCAGRRPATQQLRLTSEGSLVRTPVVSTRSGIFFEMLPWWRSVNEEPRSLPPEAAAMSEQGVSPVQSCGSGRAQPPPSRSSFASSQRGGVGARCRS